jgi:Kef-type K+ transport system membrane component KefB
LSSEVFLLIGAGLTFAFIGAALMKRVGFPQIVGFMLAGVVLRYSGIVGEGTLETLGIVVSLALGLIGYNIGLELKFDIFRGRVKKLSLIVLFEATAAFWLVTLLTYWLSGILYIALIFGALASATAPAATADVIWEYKCKGPVTESVMFVLALDDLVAVILTNAAFAFALFVIAPATNTLLAILINPILMILGSTIIGGIFGFAYVQVVNREDDRARLVELELGLIILLIGLVHVIGLSDIFAAIVFGLVLNNFIDKEKAEVPQMLEIIMSPIVMLFFVIIGANMHLELFIGNQAVLYISLAIVYLVGRTVGKLGGSYASASITKSEEEVKKYLGTCLMCQAGVALGLSFIIEEQFIALGGAAADAGIMILSVVGISTMVLELLGPLVVKWGLRQAGELGEDATCFVPTEYEEDERAAATPPASNSPPNEDDEKKVASKTSSPSDDEDE